jgi:chloramphenicol-sensitive protein RarD
LSVKTPELPLTMAKLPLVNSPALPSLSPPMFGTDNALAGAVAMSVAAYTIWGVCVVLFKYLGHVPLLEITAHRVVWSLLFVALWLSLQGRWGEVKAAIAKPRNVAMLGVTGALVGGNWLIFVWAVAAGQVLELSFGYFLAPICVVLVGTLLAREQLVGRQRLVVGLTVVAVAIQALALGRLPVFALMVGVNWAIYTYVRRKIPVQAVPGFFIECLLMTVPALIYLLVLERRGLGHFRADTSTALLLISTVTVTALPLILFAASNAKLRLVTTSLLQYITPSLHFLIALIIYGEPVNGVKLFTFLLIWSALALFTLDAFERERQKAIAAKVA